MHKPLVVTATFTPKKGRFDELSAALRRTIPAVHEEQGCLLYAIHAHPDGTIVMIEKWESEELLDRHGSGTAVVALRNAIEPFIASEPVVTRLEPIPVGDEHKGAL